MGKTKESIIERLLMKLLPYFDIAKTLDGEKVVYLRRFYLFRSQPFNLFLHHILRSDDDPDPHDHPWSFLSLVLKNGYLDEPFLFFTSKRNPFIQEDEPGESSGVRHYKPFDHEALGFRLETPIEEVKPLRFVFRPAEHVHRVILHRGPAWTLVFTGRERRPWGFVKSDRWVFWRKYLNVWDSKNHA